MTRARRPTRGQAIAFLEVVLEALRESSPADVVPLVDPTDSRPGRACPDHLRELVRVTERGRTVWRCSVEGCRQRVEQ